VQQRNDVWHQVFQKRSRHLRIANPVAGGFRSLHAQATVDPAAFNCVLTDQKIRWEFGEKPLGMAETDCGTTPFGHGRMRIN
jgi:hypothetical protein